MSDPLSISGIAEAGVKLIATVVQLISDAMKGDEEAISKMKRVDEILSPSSPTEEAFKRAAGIAASKPSRDDEPTKPTGGSS